MSHSPDRESPSKSNQHLEGIPFAKSLTPEEISTLNSLRAQLLTALENKDHKFAGELIRQLPRLRGEYLTRIIDSLQPYPQYLALFLGLMTPEDIEEFVDVLPDES